MDVEELLFETARDLGITLLTVTQRPHLTQLYTQELRMLDGAGHWQLCDISSDSGGGGGAGGVGAGSRNAVGSGGAAQL